MRHILQEERSGRLPARVRIVLTDQPDAGALKIAKEFCVTGRFIDPF